MATLVRSDEAARILGVSKATLYAYVSRGIVGRRTAVDGRTSLYSREELESLASERRRRGPVERPSIDVRIASGVTSLADDGPTYRGHPVLELARTHRFEQVAELLWTGGVPVQDPAWPIERALADRVLAATGGVERDMARLQIAAAILAADPETSAVPVARRLLALAPTVVGGPRRGSLAHRLVRAGGGGGDLVPAMDRALVLLADHELATSTLAVRIACSVRTDPTSAILAGLATVDGRLHGSAAADVVGLFEEAASSSPAEAVRRRRDAGDRIPGFGHSIYRDGDPRFAVLMEAVAALTGADRIPVVQAVVAEVVRTVGRLPNVDAALGALLWVGRLRSDLPVFAIARIAGWAAHHDEELSERPLRFRGLSRTS